MNPHIVKHKTSGTLYEIQYVVHRSASAPTATTDVYACYRLSAYDGMPIGGLVWVAECDLADEDRKRLQAGGLRVEAQ